MQQVYRSRLQVSSVSEVKTNEQKAAGQNGAQEKAPEYYEVCCYLQRDAHEAHLETARYIRLHDCVVSCLQVTLAKPLGVRFARGNDGAAYVVRTDAKLGSTDSQIEVRTTPSSVSTTEAGGGGGLSW